MLERALSTTQRLVLMVQTMYNYAKLGAKAAHMEEVDLDQLLQTMLSDFDIAREKIINVVLEALPKVWGNRELLSRVFANLITNAVKYSDKEEPAIKISLQEVIEKPLGRFVVVHLADNGPGIKEESQGEIFNMFRRGEQISKDGLGVGLAIVKRIIDLHYGEVRIVKKESYPDCNFAGLNLVLELPTHKVNFAS
jgi:signal transduction histidine kinase